MAADAVSPAIMATLCSRTADAAGARTVRTAARRGARDSTASMLQSIGWSAIGPMRVPSAFRILCVELSEKSPRHCASWLDASPSKTTTAFRAEPVPGLVPDVAFLARRVLATFVALVVWPCQGPSESASMTRARAESNKNNARVGPSLSRPLPTQKAGDERKSGCEHTYCTVHALLPVSPGRNSVPPLPEAESTRASRDVAARRTRARTLLARGECEQPLVLSYRCAAPPRTTFPNGIPNLSPNSPLCGAPRCLSPPDLDARARGCLLYTSPSPRDS